MISYAVMSWLFFAVNICLEIEIAPFRKEKDSFGPCEDNGLEGLPSTLDELNKLRMLWLEAGQHADVEALGSQCR